MSAHQLIHLLLDLLLVEHLPAGQPIHLAAQLGDAILIGVLHVGLTRDQTGEQVVTEGEIAGRAHRPYGHHYQCADGGPERDRAETDLMSGMGERIAVADRAWRSRSALAVRILVGAALRILTGTASKLRYPIRPGEAQRADFSNP